MSETEEWRAVVGLEYTHEVSNLGSVRSLDILKRHCSGSYYLHRGRVLSPQIATNGYKIVHLKIRGARQTRLVHRMVAEAFVPNHQHKPCVNHLDGDRANAAASNLAWVSNSENEIYKYQVTHRDRKIRRLTVHDIPVIRKALSLGATTTYLAATYGVSDTMIRYIRLRKTWRHVA